MIRTIACCDLIFYLTRQKELHVIRYLDLAPSNCWIFLKAFLSYGFRYLLETHSLIRQRLLRVFWLFHSQTSIESYMSTILLHTLILWWRTSLPHYFWIHYLELKIPDDKIYMIDQWKWHGHEFFTIKQGHFSWLLVSLFNYSINSYSSLDDSSRISNYWLKDNEGNYIKLYKHAEMNTTLNDY